MSELFAQFATAQFTLHFKNWREFSAFTNLSRLCNMKCDCCLFFENCSFSRAVTSQRVSGEGAVWLFAKFQVSWLKELVFILQICWSATRFLLMKVKNKCWLGNRNRLLLASETFRMVLLVFPASVNDVPSSKICVIEIRFYFKLIFFYIAPILFHSGSLYLWYFCSILFHL